MFLAFASLFLVAFLAFIAVSPKQGWQLFLFFAWSAMGLTVLVTLVSGLLTLF